MGCAAEDQTQGYGGNIYPLNREFRVGARRKLRIASFLTNLCQLSWSRSPGNLTIATSQLTILQKVACRLIAAVCRGDTAWSSVGRNRSVFAL